MIFHLPQIPQFIFLPMIQTLLSSILMFQPLQQNINDVLVNVSNWFKVNKLSINFNKTEFMVVTTKQSKSELKVSTDNNPIKQSHHIKYLGVLIDDNLNWKQQI